MWRMLKWAAVAVVVVAFVAVGYLRDFIAINLNYHLHFLQNQYEHSSAHSFFDFLNNYTYQQVYYSKYVMTLLFTVLNFLLGAFLLWLIINQQRLLIIYIWLYVLVIVASALFFGGGYLVGNPEGGYSFSRILMGFVQSPVPAAILLFGYPLYLQSVKQ